MTDEPEKMDAPDAAPDAGRDGWRGTARRMMIVALVAAVCGVAAAAAYMAWTLSHLSPAVEVDRTSATTLGTMRARVEALGGGAVPSGLARNETAKSVDSVAVAADSGASIYVT